MNDAKRSHGNEQLKTRTKQFALRVIRLVRCLPKNDEAARTIGRQLLRSATSVGANYRAAFRARSRAEFCSKLGIVEEEADESVFWMEIIVDDGMIRKSRVESLMQEGREILAMVVSSITTARRRRPE